MKIDMKPPCAGFEVVCPDGNVRCYPYHNEGDAECDARHASKPFLRAKFCQHSNMGLGPHDPCYCVRTPGNDRPGCSGWAEPSDVELRHPPCPGGEHTVRPIEFRHAPEERGQA